MHTAYEIVLLISMLCITLFVYLAWPIKLGVFSGYYCRIKIVTAMCRIYSMINDLQLRGTWIKTCMKMFNKNNHDQKCHISGNVFRRFGLGSSSVHVRWDPCWLISTNLVFDWWRTKTSGSINYSKCGTFLEWMNEWMCIYIPHISHSVPRRFTILTEWDRTSAC